MLARRLAIFLLALAPILSGCFTGEAPAAVAPGATDAPKSRPEVAPPTFLPPVELGEMLFLAEPGVAVAPDGAVYVTTPIALWRSDDGGRTYERLGAPSCLTPVGPLCAQEGPNPGLRGGADASLAVGPTGTLHYLGLLDDEATLPYQVSTDRGESWTPPVELGDSANFSDREWIVSDGKGALYALWSDRGRSGERDSPAFLTVVASQDEGRTWGPRVHVAPLGGMYGPPAVDPTTGDVLFAFDDDASLKVARSRDGGLAWDVTEVSPIRPANFPITAVDAAGTVYVAWDTADWLPVETHYVVDRSLMTPTVVLATSRDHGETWSDPVPLSPEGIPALFPWVAAGDAGRVVVAWYQGTLPAPNGRVPNVWHVNVAMSTTADQDEPVFAQSFVSQEPNHVGSICMDGIMCLAGGDRSIGDFFEVRLLPDGTPVLAFTGDADQRMVHGKVYATVMTEGTRLRG